MSNQIETAIRAENWPRARALIKNDLRRTPDSHWLLTRLGLTYYEQRQYKRALHYSAKALDIAPLCPLVLWDYAGCLAMLDRNKAALSVYRRIVRRGVKRLANGVCGEGKVWARSMVVDCYYRMAICHKNRRDGKQAAIAYRKHLALRAAGYRSYYSIEEVRKRCSP